MEDELEGEENYEQLLTAFSAKPRKRGRPASIDDGRLINRRESLLGLIDGEWGQLGWELKTARTIKDVRNALKPVDRGLHHPIQIFARDTKAKATSAQLRLRIKELARLNETVREVSLMVDQGRKSLELASAALQQVKSTSQESEIAPIFNQKSGEYEAAQQKYAGLLQKERLLQEHFENERAFIAQTELLEFIHEGRYAFTPINLANAMAGLPDISWRQSWKRCSPHKSNRENSLNYWTFQFICNAITELESQLQEISLVDLVKQKLQKYKDDLDYRVLHAKKNWYHLRRALETVAKKQHYPASRPYRILAEYQKNQESKTPLDLLREEQEQIT